TLSYQFSAAADMAADGIYDMISMTELAGDADNSNDAAFKTVDNYPVISSYPYIENFDGPDAYWNAGGTSSSWALGTPAKPVINYPSSGPNSWVTNLTGSHNMNENSWVEGPCMDFTSLDNPYVQLDVWTETTIGVGTLEVSTDFGTTWSIIGANGDPNNWYNGSMLGGTGWSGSSAGDWSSAVHKLDGIAGVPDVKIRIHFNGGYILTSEGMAFDNVHVFECIPPSAGFTFSVNGGTVTFTNTSSVATTYLWDFGDGGSSTLQNPSHTYITGGSYPVTLIASNSCESDTVIHNVIVTVGIDEYDNSPSVYVFPNPTGGECIITISDVYADNASVILYDMRGQQVLVSKMCAVSGSANIVLDLSPLAKGVYYLTFKCNSEISYTRIVVE
ncbi:MAG: PKD domain-containing protein, partial [Bacteroidota bacterium]